MGRLKISPFSSLLVGDDKSKLAAIYSATAAILAGGEIIVINRPPKTVSQASLQVTIIETA